MILTELHFHTAETSRCGKVSVRQSLPLYQEAGYKVIAVTDHFSRYVYGKPRSGYWKDVVERFLAGYRLALEEGERLGIKICLGMELRFPFDENDFLVYGLDESYLFSHPWFYEGDLAATYEEFHSQGITVFQAHPFRSCCTPADPDCLDGVEIANGNRRQNSHNDLAKVWAQKNGLVGICGSDFHELEDLTGTGVCLNRLPESGKDLGQMLVRGEYTLRDRT